MFFLFYVAKSINFEVISIWKISGQIDNSITSIGILNIDTSNFKT